MKSSCLLARALAAPIPAMTTLLAHALAAPIPVMTTLTVHTTALIILRRDTHTITRLLRMALIARGQ